MSFDEKKAFLRGPNHFQRFRVPDRGQPLARASLPGDEPLLVFERGGQGRALLVSQMTYHHLAEGRLAGEPYAVSF